MNNENSLKIFLELFKNSYYTDIEEFILALCQGNIQDKSGNYERVDGEEIGEDYYECWGVFRLGNTLYKSKWVYESHMGENTSNIIDNLVEVKAKEVTKIVYERV